MIIACREVQWSVATQIRPIVVVGGEQRRTPFSAGPGDNSEPPTALRKKSPWRFFLVMAPGGQDLPGTPDSGLPPQGGPLPLALNCAEVSGRRVWEPATSQEKG